MKKISDVLKITVSVFVLLVTSGCLTIEPEVVKEECHFAGMYTVIIKGIDQRTKEYAEQPMTYFEVTTDWKVIGSSDDGGYSGFTGDVQEDGSFTAEIGNLPGSSIRGVITAEGVLTGVQDLGQYGTYDLEGSRN